MSNQTAAVYVVTAYRYGMRDGHSYVVAATLDPTRAKAIAATEEAWRGGKYGFAVEKVAMQWTKGQKFELVHYCPGSAGGDNPEEAAVQKLKEECYECGEVRIDLEIWPEGNKLCPECKAYEEES